MRILIETDELRRLDRSFQESAAEIDRVCSELDARFDSTAFCELDPGWRTSGASGRHRSALGDVTRLARSYRDEGEGFGQAARRAEQSQDGSISGRLPHLEVLPNQPYDLWKDDDSWLDGIIKGLVAVPVLAGKTAADGWDAATGFGQSVVGGVQQGVEVGRSMISSGIGLVTNAGRGFMSFVGGFKDRLVSLIESAWNQIWDSITTTFQLVLDGMELLVQEVAAKFQPMFGLFSAAANLITVDLLLLEYVVRDSIGFKQRLDAEVLFEASSQFISEGQEAILNGLGIRDLTHGAAGLIAVIGASGHHYYLKATGQESPYTEQFLQDERTRAIREGADAILGTVGVRDLAHGGAQVLAADAAYVHHFYLEATGQDSPYTVAQLEQELASGFDQVSRPLADALSTSSRELLK